MDIFEKTRLALREYIQANPDKVKADLKRMREKSDGRDIYSYMDEVSSAYSFQEIEIVEEESYEINWCFDECSSEHQQQENNKESLSNLLEYCGVSAYESPPPEYEYNNQIKEDLVCDTGSSFFIILALWKNQNQPHLNL